MAESGRIPLFPLEVVLFPGELLPLHIFEPRYKAMTRRCLDEKLAFGIVLARPEGIVRIGCTAEIRHVVREYPDGRMDIVTTGQAVFQILEVFEEKPYYEAQVEYLADDPQPPVGDLPAQLAKLYEQCHAAVHGRSAEAPEISEEMPLSFQILGGLPFELDYKQEMLEVLSESDRQKSLLEHMRQLLPQLQQIERVRRTAGGNGHGLS